MKNIDDLKIFCTDVDGTILKKGEKTFSNNINEAFKNIFETNNLLIVASGRTYRNLRSLFFNDDRVVYLCENGNLLRYKNKTLFVSSFDDEVYSLLDELKSYQDLFIEICTPDKTYTYSSYEEINKFFKTNYLDFTSLDGSVRSIKEKIIKVSYFFPTKNMEEFSKLHQHFLDKYKDKIEIFDSNNLWIDFSPKGINKGTTLKFFMDKYSLPFSSLYCFGDGENDIDMLKISKNSYCESSGLDNVKNISNNIFSDFKKTVDEIIFSK